MVIRTYLSIMTLTVNELNVPTKRQDPSIYMLSTRDPLQTYRHLQTESKGTGKGILHKLKSKESWSSHTHQTK